MNQPQDDLAVFVDRLIEEKGLSGLDDEVLAEARKELLGRVERRINAAILAHMPEDQLEAFSTLIDSDDAQEIQAFCAKHIPDLEQTIAAELLDFRATYLNP